MAILGRKVLEKHLEAGQLDTAVFIILLGAAKAQLKQE